ncbi:LAFE_0G11078g1_1 [Lachancea fermentati]|uniref:LAFE_0G11078g1_1 n=1 Tax=Lachancea fermentati TaxID=4955 RepID=A0A1G4MI33_LACFM|nr:LAFE_0G11078g1_1 [Lachancea fermentati]
MTKKMINDVGISSNEFISVFNQLQEGEKTADKLEKMLDQLEGKIEAILSETNALDSKDKISKPVEDHENNDISP